MNPKGNPEIQNTDQNLSLSMSRRESRLPAIADNFRILFRNSAANEHDIARVQKEVIDALTSAELPDVRQESVISQVEFDYQFEKALKSIYDKPETTDEQRKALDYWRAFYRESVSNGQQEIKAIEKEIQNLASQQNKINETSNALDDTNPEKREVALRTYESLRDKVSPGIALFAVAVASIELGLGLAPNFYLHLFDIVFFGSMDMFALYKLVKLTHIEFIRNSLRSSRNKEYLSETIEKLIEKYYDSAKKMISKGDQQ